MPGYEDPERRRRIFALFDAVWRDLSQRIELAAALGARWTEVSTPFVALEGDEVVAHVGVIAIPLVLDGARTTVAGVHAVGAHPAHRRRGHIRRLLGEALAFCDQRFETAQLTTSVPDVFRPHGFRRVAQHRFAVEVPAAREGAGMTRLRHTDAADVDLLWRLLRTRAPVSSRLGVVEPGWLFVIDEIFAQRNLERVHYLPDLDAAVVLELDGATARLYDLVAPRLPRLDAVLRRLPASAQRAELYFTPDGLDPGDAGVLAVEPAWPEDNVMVRGPYAPERTGLPFILPALAHC
jgi:predicted N-acetyltransferase YhbS